MARFKPSLTIVSFDCFYFQSFKMSFFVLIVVATLIQAVSFNALIDMPALIMILLMVGSYAFTSSSPVMYARYLMFFTHYQMVIVFLKVLVDTILYIDYFKIRFVESF